MKIICFGTLDKFSRFYLDIGKEVSKNNGQLRVYTLHLSGFLYTLIRFKFSCWISLKSWILAIRRKNYYNSIIKAETHYKGVSIEKCIAFHRQLSNSNSRKNLRLQTLAYIDIIESIYKNYQPDIIISIGDTRMCIQVAIAMAKTMNIQVRYIEQGPFNRTFYDNTGVNANLSVRAIFALPKIKPNKSAQIPSEKYLRSPLYRLIDIVCMKLFEKTYVYPPDLKFTDVNVFRLKLKKARLSAGKGHRFLVICQMPRDVNSIMHSPFFKNQTELIKEVHKNLPPECYLVVREHPLFLRKYEKDFYQYIHSNGIKIENNSPLDTAIIESTVIVVNNSTVGFESICLYKPTVALGDAFYDRDGLCLKLKDRKELKQLLSKSLTFTPNKDQVDQFKDYLFSTVLKDGGISDRNLISSKSIAHNLVSEL